MPIGASDHAPKPRLVSGDQRQRTPLHHSLSAVAKHYCPARPCRHRRAFSSHLLLVGCPPLPMATIVKCPTCRRPVDWSENSAYRPFCSDRCRLIDLGAWLTEQHKIPDEGSAAGEESRGVPSDES